MKKHIKVYRVHRVLYLIYGVIIAMIFLTLSLTVSPGNNDIPSGIALMVPAIAVILTLHYFAAKGAKLQKEYGKVLSLILAVLMLPGFPIGTCIGIYLLMNNFGWENEST